MDKYRYLEEKLVESIERGSKTSGVEETIVGLIAAEDVYSAIKIALKVKPSPKFASVFAKVLLNLIAEDNVYEENFIEMKKIAQEMITEEEADFILELYTGPEGKHYNYHRCIRYETLKAASKKAIVNFFGSVLDDNSNYIRTARLFWPYVKEKI